MPFIHIRSLPLPSRQLAPKAISQLCRDFSVALGMDSRQITVTWDYLLPGHYAIGGKLRATQPEDGFPLLVELLTPDFHDDATVELMMQTIADSLAAALAISHKNIFIQQQLARSGRIMERGRVVRW